MDNKFIIVIQSRNVEDWIETNLNSVLCQTYQNWECIYVNDNSNDDTHNLYHKIIGVNSKFNYIQNSEPKLYSRSNIMEPIKDPDIIWVELDGDDWLATEDTLEKYNQFYNQVNPWITYGKMLVWTGDNNLDEANPQNTPYPEFVKKYGLYRKDVWRASHLRTFRNFLWKPLNKNDLVSNVSNRFFHHAMDLAIMFPLMEMCPPEKVQPVPFFSVVWNAHPSKMVHTQEREKPDNSIFEQEIRFGKRRYKQVKSREEIKGETLPTINVFGDYRERNSILTKATYVYGGNSLYNYNLTVFQDEDVKKYLNEEIVLPKGSKIVADLHEPPHLFDQSTVYKIVQENHERFTRILTFNKNLLNLPNVMFRNGGGEVVLNKNVHKQEYPTLADPNMMQIYPKSKMVSFITSAKTFSSGQIFRLNCAKRVNHQFRSPDVDLFGVGIREIQGKIEGLKDYRFSVAIENGKEKHYFTEKILDCFLTGTIPIYHGCPNIGDYFNTNGFFIFDTEDELIEIIKNITPEDYNNRLNIIKENFDRADKWWYDNNRYFDRYLKDLV